MLHIQKFIVPFIQSINCTGVQGLSFQTQLNKIVLVNDTLSKVHTLHCEQCSAQDTYNVLPGLKQSAPEAVWKTSDKIDNTVKADNYFFYIYLERKNLPSCFCSQETLESIVKSNQGQIENEELTLFKQLKNITQGSILHMGAIDLN